MANPHLAVLVRLACISLLIQAAAAQPTPLPADAVHIAQAPNATIGLIADGPGTTDTQIAAEMAQVIDDNDKVRILPMLGKGSVQNIADLIYLKGVDVAIVSTDALAQTMQRNLIPREASLQYIAKLFQEEIHILARRDIASLSDLNGKLVGIGSLGSGTQLTSSILINLCHIAPVVTHDAPSVALNRLRRGDIAAMFVIGGKPVPLLREIPPGTDLHFLPIPLNAQLVDAYLPTSLDHQSYPDLVSSGPPVDTVAVGSVLVTIATSSDTARGKRVNRFVDLLFERFDQFRQPWFHPKWHEVNLSAQIPGWARYPEALTLLKNTPDRTSRNSFDYYLAQSGQTASGLSNERREALFRDFLRWRDQHSVP